MMRNYEIRVPFGKSKMIARDCGVSDQTVRFALRGYTDTDKAMLIRTRAMNFYDGVEVKR